MLTSGNQVCTLTSVLPRRVFVLRPVAQCQPDGICEEES